MHDLAPGLAIFVINPMQLHYLKQIYIDNTAYVVIKWPACYKTCPVDRGARNFDDRISEVPLYGENCL